MKKFTSVVVTVLLGVFVSIGHAQVPVISSYQGGYLSWSNRSPALTMYSVEWTHSLASNTWWNDWEDILVNFSTQGVVTVPAPTYFRVAEGFDERAFEGPWLVYGPEGVVIIAFDGKGLITRFGAFVDANPVGHYTVRSNSHFEASIYDREGVLPFSGRMLDPLTLQFSFMNATSIIRRVVEPGALQGTWKGTIGDFTNVIIQIRSDGYAPVMSNLIDVTTGTFYQDTAGSIAATIYTGADCQSPSSRIQMRCVLLGGTNLFGDLKLDSGSGWLTAAVNLFKQ